MLLLLLSGTDIKTLELAEQAAVEYRLHTGWPEAIRGRARRGDCRRKSSEAGNCPVPPCHPPPHNLWWSVSLLALPAVPTKGTAVPYCLAFSGLNARLQIGDTRFPQSAGLDCSVLPLLSPTTRNDDLFSPLSFINILILASCIEHHSLSDYNSHQPSNIYHQAPTSIMYISIIRLIRGIRIWTKILLIWERIKQQTATAGGRWRERMFCMAVWAGSECKYHILSSLRWPGLLLAVPHASHSLQKWENTQSEFFNSTWKKKRDL